MFSLLVGTADEDFNLLDYADPDLDSTLTEQHDKSIFDEHLGITSKVSLTVPAAKESSPQVAGMAPSLVVSEVEQKQGSEHVVSAATTASSLKEQTLSAQTTKAEVPAVSLSSGKQELGSAAQAVDAPSSSDKTTEATVPADSAGTESKAHTEPSKMGCNFQAKFVEYSKRHPADGVQPADADAVKNSDAEKKDANTAEATADVNQALAVAASAAAPAEQEAAGGQTPAANVSEEAPSDDAATVSLPMQVDGCGDCSSGDEMDESDSGGLHVPSLSEVHLLQSCISCNLATDVEDPELVRIWEAMSPFAQVDGPADDEKESRSETNPAPSKDAEETAVTASAAVSQESKQEEKVTEVACSESVATSKDVPSDPNVEGEEAPTNPSQSGNGAEQNPTAEINQSSAPVKSPATTHPSTTNLSDPDHVAPSAVVASTVPSAMPQVSAVITEASVDVPAVAAAGVQPPEGIVDTVAISEAASAVAGQGPGIVSDDTGAAAQQGGGGNYIQHQVMAGMLQNSGLLKHQQQLLMGVGGDNRLRGPLSFTSNHAFAMEMLQQQQQQFLYQQQQQQSSPSSQAGHPYGMHVDAMPRALSSVQRFTGPPPPYPSQQVQLNPMPRFRQQYIRQTSPRLGYLPFQGHETGYGGSYPSAQMTHLSMHQARSPHPAQSPHSHQSPGGGLSHQEVMQPQMDNSHSGAASMHPGMSPRPVPSPVAWPGSSSGQSPLSGGGGLSQQPLPSPRTVGASPHMASPHQRSRSGTPQVMSPAGMQQLPHNTSQPGTPQASSSAGSFQPNTSGGHSTPGTPQSNVCQTPPFPVSTPSSSGPAAHPQQPPPNAPAGGEMTHLDMQVDHPEDRPASGSSATKVLGQGLVQSSDGGAQVPQSSTQAAMVGLGQISGQVQVMNQQQLYSSASSELGSLQSQHMPASSVLYVPRGAGSFMPRDSLVSLAQMPMQRLGYPPGMKIVQHMMQQHGGNQFPIGSSTRSGDPVAATVTTAAAHSAIGALLNQQRPMNQPGQNLGIMQQHNPPRPGSYAPRLVDSRFHLMSIPSGQIQRPYLPPGAHPQMLHQTMLENMSGPPQLPPGQGSAHTTQPHMMPSLPLLSPGGRLGLPGQSLATQVHSSQSSGITQEMMMMSPRRMPFSHPFSAGPRGLALTGGSQQPPIPGLHMTDLQHSAMMGLMGMPQPGPSSRPKRLEEQPLLLEDLLEQVPGWLLFYACYWD